MRTPRLPLPAAVGSSITSQLSTSYFCPETTLAPDGTPIIELIKRPAGSAMRSAAQDPTPGASRQSTAATPRSGPVARHLQFSSPAALTPPLLEQAAMRTPPSQPTQGAPFGHYAPLKHPAATSSRLTQLAVKAAKRLAPAFDLPAAPTTPCHAADAPLHLVLQSPPSRDKLLAGIMQAVSHRAAAAGPRGVATSRGAAMTAHMLSPPPAPPAQHQWGMGGTPDVTAPTPGRGGIAQMDAVRRLTFASPPPHTPAAHYEGLQADEGVPQVCPDADCSSRSDSPLSVSTPGDAGSIDGSFEVPATPLTRPPRAGVLAAGALPPSLGFVAGQSPPPAAATSHRPARRPKRQGAAAAPPRNTSSAKKNTRSTRNTSKRSIRKTKTAVPDTNTAEASAQQGGWGSDISQGGVGGLDAELERAVQAMQAGLQQFSSGAAAAAGPPLDASAQEASDFDVTSDSVLAEESTEQQLPGMVAPADEAFQVPPPPQREEDTPPAPPSDAPLHSAAYQELAAARAQLAAAAASQAGLAEEVAQLRAALAQRGDASKNKEHATEGDVDSELEPSAAPVPSPEPVRGGSVLRRGGVPAARPLSASVPESSLLSPSADAQAVGVASVFRSRLAAVEAASTAAGSSPLAQFNALRERILSQRSGQA